MSLDRLRIQGAPPAFAEFAAKHNALVDLLSKMTGSNGLKVLVAEGNITVSIEGELTIPGLTVTGDVTVNGDAQVVGSLEVQSDAFVNYLESSGDISAFNIDADNNLSVGSDFTIGGDAVTRLDSVQTCSPSATSNFLIIA